MPADYGNPPFWLLWPELLCLRKRLVWNKTMYKWLVINSSADLDTLLGEDYIPAEYNPRRVVEELKKGLSDAIKGILIEKDYVDKDYRSTYYNFYTKKGIAYKPDCLRLHFFDADVSFDTDSYRLTVPEGQPTEHDPKSPLDIHYFGYMVLRPTGVATIGRSVLSSDIRRGAGGSIIAARHKVHLLGYRLHVWGVPSMDQHVDISRCAHAACWSILRHYSVRFNLYKEFLTYDITRMAHAFNPGGLIPSKGLTMAHAERVFQQAGTFPLYIAKRQPTKDNPSFRDEIFFRQLQAYVDSGFPLFASTERRPHALAVIGYKESEDAGKQQQQKATVVHVASKLESLVVIDDNTLPYSSIPPDEISAFIVPLPEKIFYPAEALEKVIPVLLNNPFLDILKGENVVVRYFVTTGSAFRQFARHRESEFDPKLLKSIMQLPFAQFIWIVEFSSEDEWGKKHISARAVLDATASEIERNALWLLHNRSEAIFFSRKTTADDGGDVLKLAGMEKTALTRMENLRRVQTKKGA